MRNKENKKKIILYPENLLFAHLETTRSSVVYVTSFDGHNKFDVHLKKKKYHRALVVSCVFRHGNINIKTEYFYFIWHMHLLSCTLNVGQNIRLN